MGRLNVEQDAWSRMRDIAKKMRTELGYVAGVLTVIWAETQALGITECSADDLYLYSERKRRQKFDTFLHYASITPANFLRKKTNLCYEIVGNQKHIDALNSYKQRGKKGGKKKAILAKAEKMKTTSSSLGSNNTIHNNSIHYKTNITTANSKVSVSHNPFDLKLGTDWVEFAKTKLTGKSALKINTEAYINAIRLMREQDGLSERKIQLLFDFIRKDDFWGKNGISPVRIRSRDSDGISKCDRILSRLNPRDFETEEEKIERLKNDQIEFEKRMAERSQQGKGSFR